MQNPRWGLMSGSTDKENGDRFIEDVDSGHSYLSYFLGGGIDTLEFFLHLYEALLLCVVNGSSEIQKSYDKTFPPLHQIFIPL